MKNRFKAITAILTAAIVASMSNPASGNDIMSDPATNEWGLAINRTVIDAISLNLKDDFNADAHSIDSKKLELDCEIYADSDGYIYVNFSTQGCESVEDIEIPVSFFDRIANATSTPCFVDTANGYECRTVGVSGELVDDEGCTEPWFQIIRTDDSIHKIDGNLCSMRFAYSPMSVWEGYYEVPVMTFYKLKEHLSEGEFNYFEMYETWEIYADMPEINISYLKEFERKTNEYNSQIAELESKISQMEEFSSPNPDYNGDGRVSIADAVSLMKYISGIEDI